MAMCAQRVRREDDPTIKIESTVTVGNGIMLMNRTKGPTQTKQSSKWIQMSNTFNCPVSARTHGAAAEWMRIRMRIGTLIKHGVTIIAAMAMNGQRQRRYRQTIVDETTA